MRCDMLYLASVQEQRKLPNLTVWKLTLYGRMVWQNVVYNMMCWQHDLSGTMEWQCNLIYVM